MTKPRVLLVDDDTGYLHTLTANLEDDFDVRFGDSGDKALALLESEDFAVVCSDLRMPGMNGWELLVKVTGMPRCISGLLVTADGDVMNDPDWLDNRHIGVVFKPFAIPDFIDRVKQLAGVSRARRLVQGR